MERVQRLLSRGAVSDDPNERIELTVVPVASGPMTVNALREDGVDAEGHETFNVATSLLSDFRIMVPRSQWARAREVLNALG